VISTESVELTPLQDIVHSIGTHRVFFAAREHLDEAQFRVDRFRFHAQALGEANDRVHIQRHIAVEVLCDG